MRRFEFPTVRRFPTLRSRRPLDVRAETRRLFGDGDGRVEAADLGADRLNLVGWSRLSFLVSAGTIAPDRTATGNSAASSSRRRRANSEISFGRPTDADGSRSRRRRSMRRQSIPICTGNPAGVSAATLSSRPGV